MQITTPLQKNPRTGPRESFIIRKHVQIIVTERLAVAFNLKSTKNDQFNEAKASSTTK